MMSTLNIDGNRHTHTPGVGGRAGAQNGNFPDDLASWPDDYTGSIEEQNVC